MSTNGSITSALLGKDMPLSNGLTNTHILCVLHTTQVAIRHEVTSVRRYSARPRR